jgi:hypothetical protein
MIVILKGSTFLRSFVTIIERGAKKNTVIPAKMKQIKIVRATLSHLFFVELIYKINNIYIKVIKRI